MEIPDAKSHPEIDKKGFLQKLHTRAFPYLPQYWKRKWFLLSGRTLYFYDKEDGRGADRGTGAIVLQPGVKVADIEEKEYKKIAHVFTITTSDAESSEPCKHVLAAESAADKQHWVRQINKVIGSVSKNDRNDSRRHSGVSGLTNACDDPSKNDVKRRSLQEEETGNTKTDVKDLTRTNPSSKRQVVVDDSIVPMIDEDLPDSIRPGNIRVRNAAESVPELPEEGKGIVTSSEAPGVVSDSDNGDADVKSPRITPTEGKKRKAVDELSETNRDIGIPIKYRDRGVSGRRSSASQRRAAMAGRKAASTSALALAGREGAGASSEPRQNRSLDLDEDEQKTTQLPFAWSDPVHGDDLAEMAYEYNVELYDEGQATYDEAIFMPDGGAWQVGGMQHSQQISQYPLGVEPCVELVLMPNNFNPVQMDNGLQEMNPIQNHFDHMQSSVVMTQLNSPEGTSSTHKTKLNQKRNSRQLEHSDLSRMESCYQNELFITSFNDENITDNPSSNEVPRLKKKTSHKRPNTNGFQMELNRFNDTAKSCQKHVADLDQAVNGIAKEVAGFKGEIKNSFLALASLKTDKEKIKESIAGFHHEATKMKDQIHSIVKEAEKVQLSINKMSNEAEKSRNEQNNIRKEYEKMLTDLRLVISDARSQVQLKTNENNLKENEHVNLGQCENAIAVGNPKLPCAKAESTKKHFFSRPSSLILGLASIGKSNSLTRKKPKDKTAKTCLGGSESSIDKSGFGKISNKFSSKVSQVESPIYGGYDGKQSLLQKSASSPSVAGCGDVAIKTGPRTNSVLSRNGHDPYAYDTVSTKSQFYSRPTSPAGMKSHRPGSSPVTLTHQSSMSTVPEDRAVTAGSDGTNSLNAENKIQTIQRQSSTPNVVTQANIKKAELPRQSSLGRYKERSVRSREPSLISIPDERLIVDKTLNMSPSSSVLSFSGSVGTASLSSRGPGGAVSSHNYFANGSGVLAGSTSRPRKVYPLDAIHEVGPLATSSLRRRKKIKKDKHQHSTSNDQKCF